MLCIPIVGPTLNEVQNQISHASLIADLMEWRIDLWNFKDVETLRALRASLSCPVIFTLRKESQGGEWRESEERRLEFFLKLMELKPHYCDVEWDISKAFVQSCQDKFPSIRWIVSHHDFEAIPNDLERILEKMRALRPYVCKMAYFCHTTLDALKLLLFARKHADVLPVGMGECGMVTRIIAPIVHAYWAYAVLTPSQACAPGQITAESLLETYHYKKLTRNTGIYGLIGDPVSKSISHITHNKFIRQAGLDAVYVKMSVAEEDLELFLKAFHVLGGRGLSVTMPLKEAVIPYLKKIGPKAKAIGAVNTLVRGEGWEGMNTDARGALDAIENHFNVARQKMLIVGAGGAAKAIAYEAKERGAHVWIANRTQNRAQELAKRMEVNWIPLQHAEILGPYMLIINTTPEEMPVHSSLLQHCIWAMDIKTIPVETQFLREARAERCGIIYGWEMFAKQAEKQFRIWWNAHILASDIPVDLSRDVEETLTLSSLV